MQKQKLRASQQLQQQRTMDHSHQQEDQALNDFGGNNPSENSNMSYRLQLTPQQAAYLTKILPTHYSMQLESKPLKRTVSSAKVIKQSAKVSTEVRKKSVKDEPKIPAGKANGSRAQKNNAHRNAQELENAVYQKYQAQKDIRRGNYDHLSQALRPCVKILNLLKNNRTSWPFREPVDPEALGIPHYREIVKEPMDLSTIENNLRTNQYVTPTQFHADVSKIIHNSYTFNSENQQFKRITGEFEAFYRKITAQPGSQLSRGYSQTDIGVDNYYSKPSALEAKKSRKDNKETSYSQSAPTISMAEKKELGSSIKKLPKEDMKGILEIVKEGTGKSIVEFDLKELDPMIIRKLQVYVKERLNGQSKAKGGMNGDGLNNENDSESSFVVEGDESQ